MMNQPQNAKEWLDSARSFCPTTADSAAKVYFKAPHHGVMPLTDFLKVEDQSVIVIDGCCSINI